jgi:hypothetical protein
MKNVLVCLAIQVCNSVLTSDSPLKEAVLGFFYLAEIVAEGVKIKK